VDPARVVWIGGPQGSGKSSIGYALSRRFGLQLYSVDHRTWVHEARMPSTEFGAASLDERWLDATPQRMLGWFVSTSRHRFRLVLEDLRDLPDEPACIVEGPQLLPTNVSAVLASADQALFLLPDRDELHARLLARPPIAGTSDGVRARANATARDLLLLAMYEREVRELRLPSLRVDAPLEAMIDRAAEQLAPVVERLPRGGDLDAARAFEEEAKATQVRLYEEWLAANGGGGTSP
jgi:hypothetical protein